MKKLTQVNDYASGFHAWKGRRSAVGVPLVNHVRDVAAGVAASPLVDEALGMSAFLQAIAKDTTGRAWDISARFGACRGIDWVLEAGSDRAVVRACGSLTARHLARWADGRGVWA